MQKRVYIPRQPLVLSPLKCQIHLNYKKERVIDVRLDATLWRTLEVDTVRFEDDLFLNHSNKHKHTCFKFFVKVVSRTEVRDQMMS